MPDGSCEDELLDALAGNWNLTRKIRDGVVQNRVRAEWVLNHQFLQIHMKDVAVPPEYEAMVFVGCANDEDRYVVYWMDSFGGSFSEKGTGTRDGNAIRFVFQYPDALLHNTFTWYAADDVWTCKIEQQDDSGAWSLFCEDQLTRA